MTTDRRQRVVNVVGFVGLCVGIVVGGFEVWDRLPRRGLVAEVSYGPIYLPPGLAELDSFGDHFHGEDLLRLGEVEDSDPEAQDAPDPVASERAAIEEEAAWSVRRFAFDLAPALQSLWSGAESPAGLARGLSGYFRIALSNTSSATLEQVKVVVPWAKRAMVQRTGTPAESGPVDQVVEVGSLGPEDSAVVIAWLPIEPTKADAKGVRVKHSSGLAKIRVYGQASGVGLWWHDGGRSLAGVLLFSIVVATLWQWAERRKWSQPSRPEPEAPENVEPAPDTDAPPSEPAKPPQAGA
jgi:hypothetical protein